MEKRFGKKGVSPVIATVLLLALVFILALFVFMYFKGFISEQVEKFGQPVDNICRSVSFDVRDRQDGDTTTYFLEIVNRGNAPIYYFNMEKN